MAKAYNARCIVLKKTKLGETDLILTMLTQDGEQVRAVGKGLRKPGNRIGARLEPFSVADILLHRGKSLDIVGEVRSVETHAAIRENMLKTSAASVVAEFLEKATRDASVTETKIVPLTLACFDSIETFDECSACLLASAHLMKAMAMLGYRPSLRECALCGKPLDKPFCFDISAGGALCENCTSGYANSTYSRLLSSWAEVLIYQNFEELSHIDAYPALEIVDLVQEWSQQHLAINLRSLPFLKSLEMGL